LKLPHTADAIEASDIVEQNGMLMITTPNRLHEMSIKSDLSGALEKIAGRPMKYQVKVGKINDSASASTLTKPASNDRGGGEDEVRERALSHPGVQKFQEMFPEGKVRQVRNLKE